MPQFTTSDKPLLSFVETTLLKKFVEAVGDRCERLTQSERYQLASCISIFCWTFCEMDDDDELENLLEVYHSTIPVSATGNVVACLTLLKDEDSDNLSGILPAISAYAKNEYVDELDGAEDGGHCIHEGELILISLSSYLVEG
jgi:hypothetical protein